MNTPQTSTNLGLADPADAGRPALLQRFRLEEIQHLGQQDLLLAQSLIGHGSVWGRWQTPKSLAPSKISATLRDIDLGRRLRTYLAKEEPTAASIDLLVDKGVLALTRLGLLMRLTPSGGTGHGRARRLKPSSICTLLYAPWPNIAARAIRRYADHPAAPVGLFQCLTDADLLDLINKDSARHEGGELRRLATFVARGVWSDAPPLPSARRTTDPSQADAALLSQNDSEQYLPLPDDWLAKIGPRVLWVVQEMGPQLLSLLEELPAAMQSFNWAYDHTTLGRHAALLVQEHQKQHPWLSSSVLICVQNRL